MPQSVTFVVVDINEQSHFHGEFKATITTTHTITGGAFFKCDATGGAFTITLPDATDFKDRMITIKKIDAGGNAVTVGTTASQTIDGVTTNVLSTQYDSVTVVSDGINWHIE